MNVSWRIIEASTQDSNEEDQVEHTNGPDVMTIAEFSDACLIGTLTVDEGTGYFGTAEQESVVKAPCGVYTFAPDGYTHVWWYGK